MRYTLLAILSTFMTTTFVAAQAPTKVYLRPGHADTAQGYYLYFAAGAAPSAFAMVVCPGGGYRHVAMDHEGLQVAAWFNQLRIDAYVLRYPVSTEQFTYCYPDQLNDLKATVAVARGRHAKVGLMGFSAGGHLAGMGLTEKNNGLALGILVYPVITADSAHWHRGSFQNLFGTENYRTLGPQLASVEKRIGPHTPPLWLVHCHDDATVPVANSQLAYEAIRAIQPASHLQLYQQGKHGFGMRPLQTDAKDWLEELKKWLGTMGVL